MAEFDDDMLLGQLRDLLRKRSVGNTPRLNPDEFNRSVGNTPRSKPDEFKANDLPEFAGGADPEAYLEWERQIERLFDFKGLTDEKRCKYAILRLSESASLWYEGEKKKRARAGKEKITSWESLKRKLRKRFVPTTHKIATYRKIAELRQGKARYGGGACWGASLTDPWSRTSPRPSAHSVGSSDSMKAPSHTPSATPKPSEASRETSLSKMRCFKCQGFGHLQNSCPNRSIVTLREAISWEGLQRAEEQDDQVFGSGKQDDLVFGPDEEVESIKEFEAPVYSTGLVLEAPQTGTTTDDVKQRDQHSASNPDDLSDLIITSASTSGAPPVFSASLTWGSTTVPVATNPLLTFGQFTNSAPLEFPSTQKSYPEQRDMGVLLPSSSSSPATSVEMLSPAPLLLRPQPSLQGQQEMTGFIEDIDLTAMNEKFGLPSAVTSFGYLSSASVTSLRSLSLRPPSVVHFQLSTIGPCAFGFSLGEFSFGIDGFFCEDRKEWSDRNKTRRLTKFLFEERKKVEQSCEAVRTHHTDVRPGFKEEPPPSDPFRLPMPSATLGSLQPSTKCWVIGIRQSGFVPIFIVGCLRSWHVQPSTFGAITFGYLLVSTISVVDFVRFQCASGDDDRSELRTIPSKEEEMIRIWNPASKRLRIMTRRMGSGCNRSILRDRTTTFTPFTPEELSLRSVNSPVSSASVKFLRPYFPSAVCRRPAVFDRSADCLRSFLLRRPSTTFG